MAALYSLHQALCWLRALTVLFETFLANNALITLFPLAIVLQRMTHSLEDPLSKFIRMRYLNAVSPFLSILNCTLSKLLYFRVQRGRTGTSTPTPLHQAQQSTCVFNLLLGNQSMLYDVEPAVRLRTQYSFLRSSISAFHTWSFFK